MASPNSEITDLEHFMKIPWCAEHLRQPGIRSWVPPQSRVPNADKEHVLWSKTLNDPNAFSAFLAFCTQPEDQNSVLEHINVFLSHGDGLAGHRGYLHGGMVATILDEVSGLLPAINRSRKVFPNVSYMTGHLNITYKRPVETPGTIMATARVDKFNGRRLNIKSTVQDSTGTVLAESDAVFIALKQLL